jgi:hypothetical protein
MSCFSSKIKEIIQIYFWREINVPQFFCHGLGCSVADRFEGGSNCKSIYYCFQEKEVIIERRGKRKSPSDYFTVILLSNVFIWGNTFIEVYFCVINIAILHLLRVAPTWFMFFIHILCLSMILI